MSTDTLTTPNEKIESGTPPAPGEPPKKKKKKAPNRRRRKIIVRLIWLGVFLLFAGGVTFAIIKLFFTPEPVFYETAFISRGSLETTAMGYGYVRPAETADIAVVQSGTVLESLAETGQKVNEGDLLYILDSSTIDKAISDLQKTIDELEKENADIREEQQKAINSSTIRAPFNGKLITESEDPVKVGDMLVKGQKLATMIDDSTMLLTLYYSYAYENDIKVGMTAQISIPASMSLVDGYVSRVEKVRRITPDGTVLFEVEFAMNNPGALAKDMMATALLVSDSGEEIIPSDAGKLRNNKEQTIASDIAGKISHVDMHSYYTYSEGALFCTLDYTIDNTKIEANNEAIAQKLLSIAEEEKKYDNLRKTAPISGTIVYNKLVVGEKVDPGQAVISIAQYDRMVIEAQIDERNIGGVSVGMTVNLEQWTNNGPQMFMGVVETVSMEAKMEGSYVYFPAIIGADNYDGLLLPNMSVSFTITLERRDDILVAPVNAIKNTPVGVVVFVKTDVKPETAIELPPEIIVPPGFWPVPVTTGMGTAYGVEILSGVEDNAEVYTQDLDYDPNAMGGGMGGGMSIRVG